MLFLVITAAVFVICLAVFLRKMEPINWDDSWEESQDHKFLARAKIEPVPEVPLDPTRTVYPWTPKPTVNWSGQPMGKRKVITLPERRKRPVYTQADPNIARNMAEIYKLAEVVGNTDGPVNRKALAHKVSELTCEKDCDGVYHDGSDFKCLCGAVDKYLPFFLTKEEEVAAS